MFRMVADNKMEIKRNKKGTALTNSFYDVLLWLIVGAVVLFSAVALVWRFAS